jgi:hypothetical protein
MAPWSGIRDSTVLVLIVVYMVTEKLTILTWSGTGNVRYRVVLAPGRILVGGPAIAQSGARPSGPTYVISRESVSPYWCPPASIAEPDT